MRNLLILLSIFSCCSCQGHPVKETAETDKAEVSEANKTEMTKADEPEVETNASETLQDVSKKDTPRIYEQSEVDEVAFPSLHNYELVEYYMKQFKYPLLDSKGEPIPINGKGEADFVLDDKGNVIDVIIVKGIQPEIDKEFVRVLKLVPPFRPAKVDGKNVYSKYRVPLNVVFK
mgnify:FL=1